MIDLLPVAVPAVLAASLALVVVAARRRNVAASVNAAAGFALAAVVTGLVVAPELVVGRKLDVGFALPLWLAAAGVLHSIGMLGWYETVWWWDHLTHTVSAALVAALLYAALLTAAPQSAFLDALPGSTGTLTVAFTLAVGVAWELVELVGRELGRRFDVEPVLVHYGWRDTALDLVFDAIGALLVVALEVDLFVAAAERHPDLTEALLHTSAWIVGLGSILMASFVGLSGRVGFDTG